MTPRPAIAWLTAWDTQGVHRTGTAGDQAGADWLFHEAADLGATPEVEKFTLRRLDPIDAYLECDGMRIPGVPVFDAPATGVNGVTGTVAPIEAEPDIAAVELSPRSVYTPAYERLRRRAGHRGLVIVCKGAEPGLGLLNAERFRHPYGAPALHVPSEAREAVLAAAARRASARLVAASRRTLAQACNVVVTIRGQDSARAPVVIMTPRSSWWQSTAERGGGLPDSVLLTFLPVGLNWGLLNVLQAIFAGCTLVLQDVFDAAQALVLIERERVTHFCCAPAHLVSMLNLPDLDRYDL